MLTLIRLIRKFKSFEPITHSLKERILVECFTPTAILVVEVLGRFHDRGSNLEQMPVLRSELKGGSTRLSKICRRIFSQPQDPSVRFEH
jgi:hypothetical protein